MLHKSEKKITEIYGFRLKKQNYNGAQLIKIENAISLF